MYRYNNNASVDLVISGIVDTGVIPAEFDMLKPTDSNAGGNMSGNNAGGNSGSVSEQKELEEKQESYKDYISYSFHSVLYTSEDFYQTHKNKFKPNYNSNYLYGQHGEARLSFYYERFNYEGQPMEGGMEVYGTQFYTPDVTLSQASSAITFFTFSDDYSTITKEDTENFTLGANDVYVHLEHNAVSNIISYIFNFVQEPGLIDDNLKTEFNVVFQKYQNRFSEEAEPFTENDVKALFSLIKTILDIDPATISGDHIKKEQTMLRNNLSNLVIYNKTLHETPVTFKGIYLVDEGWSYGWDAPFVSTELASQFASSEQSSWVTEYVTDYVAPADAKYNYLITKSQNTMEQISFILDSKNETYSYGMTNLVYTSTKMMTDMIEELSQIFLILGAVIGGFAALMLFNFISVSISAKRKEIGVLRAVGARGSDVFKIFFAESSVIAFICFVISAIAGYFVCGLINSSVGSTIGISLLNYGISHVGLILALSFGVSFLATVIPVYFTAKKPPVESIRAL